MAFPPTDWGDFTTDEYQVGAPGTSYSFERWFRNPVAMAQGALGAPRVMPKAMDSNLLLAGRISVGSGYIGVNNIHWVKRIRIDIDHQGSGVRQYVYMSRSNSNGATWLPDAALFDWTITNGVNNTFTAEIDLRENFSASSGEPVQPFARSNDTNAIRFSTTAAGFGVRMFITAVSGRDDV